MKVKFFILLLISAILSFSSCEKDLLNQGVTIEITDNITENEVWKSANTYVIKGTIRIGNNLTIEPGTTIKFMDGAALDFAYWSDEYVTVTAKGTEKDPIIFTSNSSNPKAGDYSGLRFYSGANNCVFEHCVFEYGGKQEYSGIISIEEASVSFSNCLIKDVSNHAFVLGDEGKFSAFENNTFSIIEKNPIYTTINGVHTIGQGNVFASKANYGIYINNNEHMDVAGSYTWLAHDAPYIIQGRIRIGAEGSGVNLNINPGATILFTQQSGLEIAYWSDHYAEITAKGTDNSPILFSSNSTAPSPGDHRGIYFYEGSSNSLFEHCIFEYGGDQEYSGTIAIENAAVGFNSCEFREAKNDCFLVKTNGRFTSFTNNSFSDIEKNPVKITSNYAHTLGEGNAFNAGQNLGIFIDNHLDITGDYTWLSHDAPYIISGTIRIGSGGSGVNLKINPGATLRFLNNAGFEFAYWSDDSAIIEAEGTPNNPIVFTSNSPSPDNGSWKGLYFYKGVTGSKFNNCEILYAGSSSYWGAFMLDDSGSNTITLQNSRIAYSGGHGITVDSNSSLDYSTVSFDNNNGDNYRVR